MDVVMSWFVARCGTDKPVACIFANVRPNEASNPKFHGWLRYLSGKDFWLFLKPKDADGKGDIDNDMLKFIRDRQDDDLAEVIIASHDAKCFNDLITELTAAGVKVTILGYTELVNAFDFSTNLGFMDLEAVPNVFSQPLPRFPNIWHLLPEGAFFNPSDKLRNPRLSLPPSRVNL